MGCSGDPNASFSVCVFTASVYGSVSPLLLGSGSIVHEMLHRNVQFSITGPGKVATCKFAGLILYKNVFPGPTHFVGMGFIKVRLDFIFNVLCILLILHYTREIFLINTRVQAPSFKRAMFRRQLYLFVSPLPSYYHAFPYIAGAA